MKQVSSRGSCTAICADRFQKGQRFNIPYGPTDLDDGYLGIPAPALM